MERKLNIVVTMPAYNAEQTIERTFHDIPPELAHEILVVDDASQDHTVEIAKRLGLKIFSHQTNRGYGANQKTCYDLALEANASVVVLLHPDYQYDPRTLIALVQPIIAGQADFTFGSRFAAGGDPIGGGMPLYRYISNRFITWVENRVLGTNYSELHSGLKAYTAAFLQNVDYHSYADSFVFDSQLIIEAISSGWRVQEVPISTHYGPDSSSISVIESVKYGLLTLLELVRKRRRRTVVR